jgi:hypothetical protein
MEVRMAEHGYLPEYDEEISSDRERGSRDVKSDRERDFMFGGRDEERFGRGRADHPDSHYLNWRDRHMRELDRDYEEYRREREQQFHQDFSAWRLQKHGNPPPLQAGMTQTSTSGDTDGTLELSTEAGNPAEGGANPMAAATLGTTSSGRSRR